ncbi:unnamed protein product [Caenorhabditis bovis]|uniref:E2F-associated phosphoprotein n=1 Tax=Caenorhabditis bovis TaxID=2654633 RepID=A0A8S1EYY3_9PELO|nr:unnamed protein product [Caenorhabditis bovis]
MFEEENEQDQEVTAATMRRLAFEKIDDDYYLGAGGPEDVVESDDEASSDDEVKSHLRKLAGVETTKMTKDAFGRRRRRSEFEDEMDEELDRSISEYACEHMGAASAAVRIEDVTDEEEEAKQRAHRNASEIEQQMVSLELLPYDVELTDSEVDPEMPAAVLKDDNGVPLKLVYSCRRGEKFDIVERKKRQKERRMRVAASRQPEKQRREEMMRNVAEGYKEAVGSAPQKKRFADGGASSQPLASILKKSKKKEEEPMEEESKEKEDEDEANPIKKAIREREKEIEKNDELFYDDEEDEENEKWVKDRRREDRGDDLPGDNEIDGVLSCPGCMIELTRDCQRHEIYKTQYRAMFVSNCRLDDEKMTVEKTGKARRKEKQRQVRAGVPTSLNDDDLFTPVKCALCGTLVAMMDSDEVYHFFNVLSGYS